MQGRGELLGKDELHKCRGVRYKTRVVKKIPTKTAGLAGPSATALGCSNIT